MVRIRDAHYIQIIRFKLENGNAQTLATKVEKHLTEWISKCPGFVSANLHVSEDGKHMINYAQWRDQQSFEDFTNNENQAELKDTIESCNPDRMEADHFELVAQQSIEDKFWSKSHI